MKHLRARRRRLLCLLLAGCLTGLPVCAAAEPAHFNAQAYKVSDGDSLRVVDAHGRQRRLRVAFVDAPELNQAYGQASAAALRRKVQGQVLAVTVWERDRYGREVAQVTLANQDLGLWLLQQGLAWHYTGIARRKQNANTYRRYAQAQAQAQQRRLGLWARPQPQPPWDFRRHPNTGRR